MESIRESIEAMLPSSGSGSLAWWGMDAQYSEKRRGQFEHGGFMQGIRSKQDTECLLDLRASMSRVLNCGMCTLQLIFTCGLGRQAQAMRAVASCY